MLHIICDICKKQIPEAITSFSWGKREKNYRIVLDKAICSSCMEKFDEELKNTMSEKSEYGFLDHTRVLKSTLERMCD